MLLVGTDLIEIGRIEKSMRNPRFCGRVLGGAERAQLALRGFPVSGVAASFCAKEAFSKAVGTGLSGFDLRDAQLLRLPSGRPELRLSGRALRLAGGVPFSVSVTHTARYASVVVAGESDFFQSSKSASHWKPAAPHAEGEGLRMLQSMLRPRDAESNKGDYGRLLCVCGSEGMAGAAVMSVGAALRCGAGIVEEALPRSIYAVVASRLIEAVYTLLDPVPDGSLPPPEEEKLLASLARSSACLVGCGLGRSPAARSEVFGVIRRSTVPMVVDADGINLVAEHIDVLREAKAPLILTPHPGEMGRLLGTGAAEVQSRREECARGFAKEHNVILVLKGAGTLVASPEGRLYRNTTGNPGMARGGSGDVLAGMIASFLAQGIGAFEAAAGAVYLHGLAGDRCAARLSQYGMLPTDMIGALPDLFREIGR